LNWSASLGCRVWSHLISSSKVHLTHIFTLTGWIWIIAVWRLILKWLAQLTWILLLKKRMCLIVQKLPFADPRITSRIMSRTSLWRLCWQRIVVSNSFFLGQLSLSTVVFTSTHSKPSQSLQLLSIPWHVGFRALFDFLCLPSFWPSCLCILLVWTWIISQGLVSGVSQDAFAQWCPTSKSKWEPISSFASSAAYNWLSTSHCLVLCPMHIHAQRWEWPLLA
jgi:hypothetical protein